MPDEINEVIEDEETPGTGDTPGTGETPGGTEGGDDTPGDDTPGEGGDDEPGGDEPGGDDDPEPEPEPEVPVGRQKIIRQTITADDAYHAVDFGIVTIEQVLIKTFTAGNIFVSLGGEPESDAGAAKIGSQAAQVCVIGNRATWDKTYIKASSSGEVEVQLLVW